MSLYDAIQQQRYIERQIRRWKRESGAMEAARLDNSSAKQKVREWQARQRNFIEQTGLRRDYFRVRAGKQNLEMESKRDIINLLSGINFRVGNPNVPKVASMPDGSSPATSNVSIGVVQGVVPKGTPIVNVRTIAGKGTSTPLRDIQRLDAMYGGDPREWQKITGTALVVISVMNYIGMQTQE